jgi:hypothetical protein
VSAAGVLHRVREQFPRHRRHVVGERAGDEEVERPGERDRDGPRQRCRALGRDLEDPMPDGTRRPSSRGRIAKMIVRICAMLSSSVAIAERAAATRRRPHLAGDGLQREPRAEQLLDDVVVQVAGECANDPRPAGRAGDPRGPSPARWRGRRARRGRRRCRAPRG